MLLSIPLDRIHHFSAARMPSVLLSIRQLCLSACFSRGDRWSLRLKSPAGRSFDLIMVSVEALLEVVLIEAESLEMDSLGFSVWKDDMLVVGG